MGMVVGGGETQAVKGLAWHPRRVGVTDTTEERRRIVALVE